MRQAPLFLSVMALLLALAACQSVLPARTMSDIENRMLTQRPQLSMEAAANGSLSEDTERFAADQLPLRDHFVSAYMAMQYALGRRAVGDAILGAERLFARSDGWSIRNVRLNAAALRELEEQTGKAVYLLAVPSAARVYPEQLPAHAPVADEAALFAAAAQEAHLLPLLPALLANRDAPLYYATDHHWTGAGAQIGYETVCDALGLTPRQADAAAACPGFYGSFYARYPLPWIEADTFSCALPSGIRLRINGEEKDGLIDPDALASRDKYAALLYGNHACIELLNDAAPADTLLVIKDSYANALLPLLSQHYSRITAVDPRYYSGNIIELANRDEGGTILCVYGMNTLSTGRTIALLEGL